MDSTFGTWNVRTLFKTGALISLLSQLKQCRICIIALQATKWQGKDIMDMTSLTHSHTHTHTHTHIYTHTYTNAHIYSGKVK